MTLGMITLKKKKKKSQFVIKLTLNWQPYLKHLQNCLQNNQKIEKYTNKEDPKTLTIRE